MQMYEKSAAAMAQGIREGEFSAEELLRDCLARIDSLESTVGAWVFIDPDYAIEQAQAADRERASGKTLGPLHGVPIGIKDIFDTADMPTEDGTVLHAGRTPAYDATAVAALREAGAVIMGKTVTTELAVYAPGKTTNPHDASRTPGGSSSGSAAAVSSAMVPLAIGTQTNGSVIRPASYCGVFGYKPTHGQISRHRVLQQSRTLDQVGVFARNIEDAALITEQMLGHDARDPDTHAHARQRLLDTVMQEPPLPPRIAFVKSAQWDNADEDVHDAFAELCDFLGDQVDEVALPAWFDHAQGWHRTIMESDLAVSFAREYERGQDQLSAELRQMIERGQTYLATDYTRAVRQIPVMNNALHEIFEEFDVIITPSTTGEAPMGLASTGSPQFCTTWTLCGVPAVTLPLLQGNAGMPIGVQMVAARRDDARLLRTARWLVEKAGL